MPLYGAACGPGFPKVSGGRALSLVSLTHPIGSENPAENLFLLRKLNVDFVKSFGEGTVFYADKALNRLASQVTKMSRLLVSFGFLSSKNLLEEFMPDLTDILDGRVDAKARGELFEKPEDRFISTGESEPVTTLKISIISLIDKVADLCQNYRLAEFLNFYKSLRAESKAVLEKSFVKLDKKRDNDDDDDDDCEIGLADNLSAAEKVKLHDLQNVIFDHFEDQFTNNNGGGALQLYNLSHNTKNYINTILVDCLMYEDDALFKNALSALDRQFDQRRILLEATQNVTLLADPTLPVFGNGLYTNTHAAPLFLPRVHTHTEPASFQCFVSLYMRIP